ncbi:MAG: PAS domain-containing protein [Bacteroidota bacterium]
MFNQEEDLQNAMLHAPIGVCILNADTIITELVNDRFLEIAGKRYEDIFGKYYWDAFAEVRAYYEAALDSVIATGQPYSANEIPMKLIRHGLEEDVFVTFVYSPIKNKTGDVTKVVVWVLENTMQVADRKKEETAKQLLKMERDRLQSYFIQAPAAICILQGPNFVYELINPAYERLLPGRELLNRPMFTALPELKGTPIQEMITDVYQYGKSFEINELLIPVSDFEGGPTRDRYFNSSFQARRNDHNEIDGVVNIVNEVTEMIKVQQALQEAREQADQQKRVYETITSGTPDLMYVWDLNYNFTYVNRALLNMWGKSWETAIGKGLRENGYEEWHAQMHEREIDHVKNTKESVRGEVAFPHAVLGKRIYDYILIPVLNDKGEVEAVAGTTRDVTEHRLAQESLAKTTEELQAINEEMLSANEEQAASNEELISTNEELAIVNQQLLEARQKIEESEGALRLAIEAANFGTWHIHSVTREFITDSRLKELFGYYPDEKLSIEQAIAQITEEYRGFVANKLENAIYNNGDYDVSYPVIGLHDGRLRWLRAIGNLKEDPSGAFSAFTGVVMDITEQKMDELRKNDFIGMVSHELKTPLTSMKGYIQMLQKLKRDDTVSASMLEKANSQVGKMTAMINGFLNVSRLESGKIHIDHQEFDFAGLINEVEEEIRTTVSSHTVIFEPVESVYVNADHDKIGQVIHNLISNAVKYSPANSTITVTCKVSGSNVYFSVKDQGMGIKPDDLAKIFNRYYRVEGSHMFSISGFGIGLYLCSEIIQRHHGTLNAESEFEKGSTFTFSLPISEIN